MGLVYLLPISERVAYLSRVHVGTTIPLLGLCLVPFFARIYVRVWPVWRFGWDDGFIVAALVIIAHSLVFPAAASSQAWRN